MTSSPGRPRSVAPASDSACRESTEAQASALYHRHGAAVLRYCRPKLRSRDEAEDAVQTTFLRAYAALCNGVTPEYEAAWLFKIAHNVCLSRRITAARRAQVETAKDPADLEHVPSAPGSADEVASLRDALAELPANLRHAILLREWQGLSYAEIAETLGVSLAATETLIFRARRRLAELLRPSEPVEVPIAA